MSKIKSVFWKIEPLFRGRRVFATLTATVALLIVINIIWFTLYLFTSGLPGRFDRNQYYTPSYSADQKYLCIDHPAYGDRLCDKAHYWSNRKAELPYAEFVYLLISVPMSLVLGSVFVFVLWVVYYVARSYRKDRTNQDHPSS